MVTKNRTTERRRGDAVSRRRFLTLAVLCAVATFQAHAQTYPNRPVRLLVPFAPGGGADTISRILTPKLHEALGQPWVVDNRGGAAGNLAAETVARAAPDGHTVLMGFATTLTVNPSLYKLPYNVEKDLQPVTMLATAQYILVIHSSVPANSVKELIALAKQKPGSLNYSSGGIGTPLHLAAELFQKRAGVKMVHLAYKGGGPAAAALLGGEAQVLFGSIASSIQHVKSGRLKALATTGSKRSKVIPELPTMIESGFPGFDVTSWYGLLVPATTPMTVVNKLRDAAIKSLALPDVVEAMSRQGLDVETSTPQEFAARIKAETATWADVIRTAGIKAE
jgi:tripartite-type tricarboxylate transporter receptor subunit TctC